MSRPRVIRPCVVCGETTNDTNWMGFQAWVVGVPEIIEPARARERDEKNPTIHPGYVCVHRDCLLNWAEAEAIGVRFRLERQPPPDDGDGPCDQ
jgi:hypothetical protein